MLSKYLQDFSLCLLVVNRMFCTQKKQHKMRKKLNYEQILLSILWYCTQIWHMSAVKKICPRAGQWAFRIHTLKNLKTEQHQIYKHTSILCLIVFSAWVQCSSTMCLAAHPRGPVLRTW